MKKLMPLGVLIFLMYGCGGTYVANEYPLDEERVSSFEVSGDVQVSSAYEESRPTRVANLDADLKQISERFAEQMSREIQQRHDGSSGSDKTIQVRVTDMDLANRFVYLEGRIQVEIELGNGEQISFERRNGSPGVVDRVLNGTIAMGVIEALEDETVRAYLAE